MNTRHIWWRFWYANPEWSRPRRWSFHATGDQIAGWMYCGVTIAGHSLLYSSQWRAPRAKRKEDAR